MPAHRPGDAHLYSLKTVCVFPDNPKRGLDGRPAVMSIGSVEKALASNFGWDVGVGRA